MQIAVKEINWSFVTRNVKLKIDISFRNVIVYENKTHF